MNDQQIERLIKQSERKLQWNNWRVTFGFGAMTVVTSVVTALSSVSEVGFICALILFGYSLVAYRYAVSTWKEFLKAPVFALWKDIAWGERFVPDPSPPTKSLRISLTEFYRTDKSAEVLPLAQGLRLLSVYELQQQRRVLIWERITQLHALRDKLLRTATQLESLGESRPDTTGSVQRAQSELAALERLTEESVASCKRLESILMTTQKALQVRQLHHELTQLQSDITSTISQPLMESQPTNIEDQISREIETYLQLERETEVHFRDL